MYRFEVSEVLDERFLTKLVDKFRNNELRIYEKLDRYYMAKNDAIQNRQMKNGKPNNRIAHGFCRYITNMATSYFLGKPVEYSFDDTDSIDFDVEEYKASIKGFLNDSYNFDYEISKAASKMGMAFELIYINESGLLKTKEYDATSVIPIFSSSVDEYLNACIRLYEKRDIDGKLVCDYADVYDKSDIYRFKRTNKIQKYELYDIQKHYLSDVPFIVYLNNKEASSDYEGVIDLIDAYDKAQSNTANDMDYFTYAYLVVTGAGGGFTDDYGEDIEDSRVEKSLRNSRIIYLDEKGDAKFLVKGSDTSSSEAYKERTFKHIFFTSQVPAMTDESFAGDLSGVAIKYKLIGLEQLAIMKENAMRLAKVKKLKLITDFINFKKSTRFDSGIIKQKYTRNFIENISDTIDDVTKLSNTISKKSQLEMLPKQIVKDVDTELERIEVESNDGLFSEEI